MLSGIQEIPGALIPVGDVEAGQLVNALETRELNAYTARFDMGSAPLIFDQQPAIHVVSSCHSFVR